MSAAPVLPYVAEHALIDLRASLDHARSELAETLLKTVCTGLHGLDGETCEAVEAALGRHDERALRALAAFRKALADVEVRF